MRQVPQELNEYTVNTEWFGTTPDWERFVLMEVSEPGTRIALFATEQADVINLSAPTLSQAAVIDHSKVLTNLNSVFVQVFFLNLWEEGTLHTMRVTRSWTRESGRPLTSALTGRR